MVFRWSGHLVFGRYVVFWSTLCPVYIYATYRVYYSLYEASWRVLYFWLLLHPKRETSPNYVTGCCYRVMFRSKWVTHVCYHRTENVTACMSNVSTCTHMLQCTYKMLPLTYKCYSMIQKCYSLHTGITCFEQYCTIWVTSHSACICKLGHPYQPIRSPPRTPVGASGELFFNWASLWEP